MSKKKTPFWSQLKNHFLSGLVLLGPVFLTFVLILYLVRLTDRFVVNPLFQALPLELDAMSKVFLAKLAIAFFVVFTVSAIGYAAKKFLFRQLFAKGEALLKGIPVFSRVYLFIKEIAQAFFGDKTGVFKRVVFLEYPRKGLYSMGFVTQERRWEATEKTGKDVASVFIPKPPNPTTGYLIFVPKDELIATEITVEEGLRLVISGGAAIPGLKKESLEVLKGLPK